MWAPYLVAIPCKPFISLVSSSVRQLDALPLLAAVSIFKMHLYRSCAEDLKIRSLNNSASDQVRIRRAYIKVVDLPLESVATSDSLNKNEFAKLFRSYDQWLGISVHICFFDGDAPVWFLAPRISILYCAMTIPFVSGAGALFLVFAVRPNSLICIPTTCSGPVCAPPDEPLMIRTEKSAGSIACIC